MAKQHLRVCPAKAAADAELVLSSFMLLSAPKVVSMCLCRCQAGRRIALVKAKSNESPNQHQLTV